MPSHVKFGQCGIIARGDGFLLVEQDVQFNDVADKLAKAVVEAHRVPYKIRKAIETHDELTTRNAMWIAKATLMANHQKHDRGNDTQTSRAKAAETTAEKRRLKKQHHQQQPMHLDLQTDNMSTTKAKSVANGGHSPADRKVVVHSVQSQVNDLEQADTATMP